MYQWPSFAVHLGGVQPASERLLSFLSDLATPRPAARAQDVLSSLFESGALVDEIVPLAPHVHHVGLIAPANLTVAAVTQLLRESPFNDRIRQFASVVLAKDLSALLGANVHVTVVQGSAQPTSTWCPTVEVFVADLPSNTLAELIDRETGCHVALGLERGNSFDQIREALHAHGCWEIPLMRSGAVSNPELGSSVLYVDIAGPERTRRLEFIAPNR